MNRRSFFGVLGGAAGLSTATLACPKCEQGTPVPHPRPMKGPFTVRVDSPPNDKNCSSKHITFDTYKQAQNWAYARESILRQSGDHEAGSIKVLTANGLVVMSSTWGETWSVTVSCTDGKGGVVV